MEFGNGVGRWRKPSPIAALWIIGFLKICTGRKSDARTYRESEPPRIAPIVRCERWRQSCGSGRMAKEDSSTEQEGHASKECAQRYFYPKLWRHESAGVPGLQRKQVHGQGPGHSEGQFGFCHIQNHFSEL